jgi:hypothetical protein
MKNRIGKFNWRTGKMPPDYQYVDYNSGVPPFQKWEKRLQIGNST